MHLRAIAIGAILTLGMACGGGDAPPRSGATTPPATPSASPLPPASIHGTLDLSTRGGAASLTIALRDRFFEPTFIRVAAGQVLSLSIENAGQLPHTFTIVAPDVNHRLSAGERTSVTLTVPARGDVAFFCRLHAHVGMWGGFFLGIAASATPTPY